MGSKWEETWRNTKQYMEEGKHAALNHYLTVS